MWAWWYEFNFFIKKDEKKERWYQLRFPTPQIELIMYFGKKKRFIPITVLSCYDLTFLQADDFHLYFSGKKRLLPSPSDLRLFLGSSLHVYMINWFTWLDRLTFPSPVCSYYNWVTHSATSSNSANYAILSNEYPGLLFKNTKDRKVVNVDPEVRLWISILHATFHWLHFFIDTF